MSETFKSIQQILPKGLARDIMKYSIPVSYNTLDVCRSGLIELYKQVKGKEHINVMRYSIYTYADGDLIKKTLDSIFPPATNEELRYTIFGALDRGNENGAIEALNEYYSDWTEPWSQKTTNIHHINWTNRFMKLVLQHKMYKAAYVIIDHTIKNYIEVSIELYDMFNILLVYDQLDMWKYLESKCDDVMMEDNIGYFVHNHKALIDNDIINDNETSRYICDTIMIHSSSPYTNVLDIYSSSEISTISDNYCFESSMYEYADMCKYYDNPYEVQNICRLLELVNKRDPFDLRTLIINLQWGLSIHSEIIKTSIKILKLNGISPNAVFSKLLEYHIPIHGDIISVVEFIDQKFMIREYLEAVCTIKIITTVVKKYDICEGHSKKYNTYRGFLDK